MFWSPKTNKYDEATIAKKVVNWSMFDNFCFNQNIMKTLCAVIIFAYSVNFEVI